MSIEAKSLRIGNLVEIHTSNTDLNNVTTNKNHTFEVKTISSDMITIEDDNTEMAILNLGVLHPIPLTEEWLLKMGFDIVYSSNFRLKFDHSEHTRCGFDFSHTADKSMEGFRFYGHYIGIKYVHDLQNIFYSLTGEELTIKE